MASLANRDLLESARRGETFLSHPARMVQLSLPRCSQGQGYVMNGYDFESRPAGERSDAILQLYAAECAIRRTLVEVIAAHDRTESWIEDGATSMTAWLTAQLGVAHGTASQMVTVGSALEELPAIAEAFGEGRLSWDKTRSLARFATIENEQALSEEAQGLTAAQVQTLARRMHMPNEADQAHTKRSVRTWWDRDRQWFHLHGRLPGADGALVEKALERAEASVPRSAHNQVYEPIDMRLADALVDIASTRVGSDPDPDRANLVVHVDLGSLVAGGGVAEIEAGPTITAKTARRLACDARLQTVLEGPDGLPVGIGRISRTIPVWLNRQIRQRDQGCRFPGCGRTRWVHAHHLVHWANGGPTDLDNLATLCVYHHRLVHDGGWKIEGCPNGDLIFIRPNGRSYQPRPQTLRQEVRERLIEPVLQRAEPAFADSS